MTLYMIWYSMEEKERDIYMCYSIGTAISFVSWYDITITLYQMIWKSRIDGCADAHVLLTLW